MFVRFGRLSPADIHSADSRFDSGVKWCIHVLSIFIYLRKRSFLLRWNSCKQRFKSSTRCCFWSTVSEYAPTLKSACSCKMVDTLSSDIFKASDFSRNSNLWSVKTSLWSFFGVFLDNCRICASWAFIIIRVCTTAFKVSVPPLNHCFRRSGVQITLIKPLLCLNTIFRSESYALSTHNIHLAHCFENL